MVSFPLLPQLLAQLSSHPLVQFFERPFHFGQLEVVSPASQNRINLLLDEPIKSAAPSPMERFLELSSHPLHRLSSHFESWFDMMRHRVAQKLTLPRSAHRTFLSTHLELESSLNKSSDRFQHSVSRSARADVDVAIIRVAAKR